MYTNICIAHNKIWTNKGWKVPVRYKVTEIVSRIQKPATITTCDVCENVFNEQYIFLLGGV